MPFLPDRNEQVTTEALLHPLEMSLHLIKHTFQQSLINLHTHSHFHGKKQQILTGLSAICRLMSKSKTAVRKHRLWKVPNYLCH